MVVALYLKSVDWRNDRAAVEGRGRRRRGQGKEERRGKQPELRQTVEEVAGWLAG